MCTNGSETKLVYPNNYSNCCKALVLFDATRRNYKLVATKPPMTTSLLLAKLSMATSWSLAKLETLVGLSLSKN